VACFVKVFGVTFLGMSRAPHPHPAHESRWTMIAPMCVLAGCCVIIGLRPTLVAPLLDQALAVWTRQPALAAGTLERAAPLGPLSLAAILLLGCLILGAGLLHWRIRTQPLSWTETWGCGYTGATPRMQYTASSFAQFLVTLFDWALRPTVERPRIESLFPAQARFASHVPEIVLDRVVLPVFSLLARFFLWFRLMQQGNVQVYLLYIFAIVVLLLVFWR
jgi:hydrogenase-4 component B